jgi:hypothetical protein
MEATMPEGLSKRQRDVLGVAQAAAEVLHQRGEAEHRPHYVHRLGLWAIHGFPATGRRGGGNTPEIRAARASLSRTVARLERRRLMERFHRSGSILTAEGARIGSREVGAFRSLIDARALCGLEMIRDPAGVAGREFGRTLEEIRAGLLDRVKNRDHSTG